MTANCRLKLLKCLWPRCLLRLRDVRCWNFPLSDFNCNECILGLVAWIWCNRNMTMTENEHVRRAFPMQRLQRLASVLDVVLFIAANNDARLDTWCCFCRLLQSVFNYCAEWQCFVLWHLNSTDLPSPEVPICAMHWIRIPSEIVRKRLLCALMLRLHSLAQSCNRLQHCTEFAFDDERAEIHRCVCWGLMLSAFRYEVWRILGIFQTWKFTLQVRNGSQDLQHVPRNLRFDGRLFKLGLEDKTCNM